MSKSGRAINNWPPLDGGIPPSFDNVKLSSEKIDKFVEHLLGHTMIPQNMRHFLVANGLRFFGDFCEILKHEPTGKYDSMDKMTQNHAFVYKVRTFSSMLHVPSTLLVLLPNILL